MNTPAKQFKTAYLTGLGISVGACVLLAMRSTPPSRGLAVIGAATTAAGLYAAAAWPQTKQMVVEVAVDVALEEVKELGASLFSR